MSEAELVKQFTEETGHVIPTEPQLMSEEEVNFLTKMILDEVMEFMATVHEPKKGKEIMKQFIDDSKDIPKEEGSEEDIIAAQADALTDVNYYSLNAAAKKGVNLSKVFMLVHEANMDKRVDGKFLRREDGKILKRPGWTPPDITREIINQKKNGAFT